MPEAVFGESPFGEEYFGTTESPDVVPAGRVGWQFYDGTTTYVFPVNPDSATMPAMTRTITTQATCTGGQVRFQGKPDVKRIQFSGVTLTEEQFRTFEEWHEKRKQIRITDDLEQDYWVFLTGFSPTRKGSVDYPWYMEYQAEGIVLNRGPIYRGPA